MVVLDALYTHSLEKLFYHAEILTKSGELLYKSASLTERGHFSHLLPLRTDIEIHEAEINTTVMLLLKFIGDKSRPGHVYSVPIHVAFNTEETHKLSEWLQVKTCVHKSRDSSYSLMDSESVYSMAGSIATNADQKEPKKRRGFLSFRRKRE